MDIAEMMAKRQAAEARREQIAREQEQHRLEDATQPYRMVKLLEAILAEQVKQTALLEAIATRGNR
jgi:hypothetical protein